MNSISAAATPAARDCACCAMSGSTGGGGAAGPPSTLCARGGTGAPLCAFCVLCAEFAFLPRFCAHVPRTVRIGFPVSSATCRAGSNKSPFLSRGALCATCCSLCACAIAWSCTSGIVLARVEATSSSAVDCAPGALGGVDGCCVSVCIKFLQCEAIAWRILKAELTMHNGSGQFGPMCRSITICASRCQAQQKRRLRGITNTFKS